MKLPTSTRIRFTKTLQDNGEYGRVFAREGDTGTILSYDAPEGYVVKADNHAGFFGATRQEFEPIK